MHNGTLRIERKSENGCDRFKDVEKFLLHCYESKIMCHHRRRQQESVVCNNMIEWQQQLEGLLFELTETELCQRRQTLSYRAVFQAESNKKRSLFIVLACILINLNYVAPNRYSTHYETNVPVQQQQQSHWSLLYYPHKCQHPTLEHYRQFHGTIEQLQPKSTLLPLPLPHQNQNQNQNHNQNQKHHYQYHHQQRPLKLGQYQQQTPLFGQPPSVPQLVHLRSPTFHEPTNLMIRENELNLLNRQQLIQLRQQQQQQNQFEQQRQNDFDLINEQIIVQHQPPTLMTTTTTTRTETETETNDQFNEQRRQQQQRNLLLQRQNLIIADIDECLDERACGRGASCENLPGSFRCSCPPGFTGDPMVECIGK